MANEEIDLSLAIQMQAQFEEELRVSLLKQEAEQSPVLVLSHNNAGSSKKNRFGDLDEPPQEKLSVPLTDPSWELIDPNPDIHMLFLTFNNQFFWGRLAGIEVKWSPRMTLCAGVCSYERRGGLCSVRLSLPLLKLRPRKDLIETLLHEMIHAYLFVTANNRDRDGHGPEFHKHMYRINGVAGTKISVYHSFHDEVDVYRQHIWQCDGPCRKRRPYFGLVKRAMNRAPGPRDPWWQQHQQSCGGTYTKIQEPEGYGTKKKKNGILTDKKGTSPNSDIRKFFGTFKGEGKPLSNVPSKKKTNDKSNVPSKKKTSDKSKVGGIPPLKENIPSGSKSQDHWGSSSSSLKGNSQSNKSSNIHGFGSTGTGVVSQVNVNNASRSKVHGFTGNAGPPPKKPRLGSDGASGSNSGGKSATGNSGSGLALKTGGGSRTFTVKGKTQTTKNETETGISNATPSTFSGQGNTIGGQSNGVSRLLSLYSSSSSNKTTSDKNPLSVKSEKSSSSSKSPLASCPVCNKEFPRCIIDKHISDCIGEFDDDDDDWDDASPIMGTDTKNGKVQETETISVSSDDDDDLFVGVGAVRSVSVPSREPVEILSDQETSREPVEILSDQETSREPVEILSDQETSREPVEILNAQETYPCPVCNERFSQARINEHLDTHFQ